MSNINIVKWKRILQSYYYKDTTKEWSLGIDSKRILNRFSKGKLQVSKLGQSKLTNRRSGQFTSSRSVIVSRDSEKVPLPSLKQFEIML